MTTTFPTDNRTIINECDNTGDWTATDGPTAFTSSPTPIEATDCMGMNVSNTNEDAYDTITSDDWTLGSLFVWMRPFGTMDTIANGGAAIQVGDGTNREAYHVGGSDVSGFRHEVGPHEWTCFILDLSNKPANSTNLAGSEASLDESAITQVGVYFQTIVKSVGGVENCFWDIIRWANAGDDVIMQGGTTVGAAGNGEEAAAIDRSIGNQQAYGVIRELGAGVYGIQGNLTIGNAASASDQFWVETNVTYAWEDRGLFDRNYYRFNLIGSSTASDCQFSFTSCTFNVPVAAAARFDGNGADINFCRITGSTFIGFNVGIVGSDDTSDDWTNCSYTGSGALEVQGCDHTGSTFTETVECALIESQDETSYDDTSTEGGFNPGASYAASDTITLSNGALITVDTVSSGAVTEFTVTTSEGYPANTGQTLSQASTSGSGTGFEMAARSANLAEGGSIFYDVAVDPDGELDDTTFTMGTDDTHAAVFGPNIPTTITLRGWTVSGYSASDEQPDSVLHFLDTSGTITVNIVDGSGTFSTKSEGATIDVVISPVTTKVTVEESDGTMIENARVFLETADDGGTGFPYQDAVTTLVQAAGTATLTASAVHDLATGDQVVVRGATIEGYNKVASITVTSTTVFTYAVDSGLGSPAGGTPVFSYVPIHGLTDSNGEIETTKAWSVSQSLSGWARKSTASPFFKQTAISIADASGGTDLLIALQPDD